MVRLSLPLASGAIRLRGGPHGEQSAEHVKFKGLNTAEYSQKRDLMNQPEPAGGLNTCETFGHKDTSQTEHTTTIIRAGLMFTHYNTGRINVMQ